LGACLLIAVGLGACSRPSPSSGLLQTPTAQLFDYDDFVCEAMPVLIRRCSYLACHGQPTHALRVYSPGKLRSVAGTRADRDGPLTADEIEANFDAATGVLLAGEPAASSLLLQKPLRAPFGGAEHHGVGIFPIYPHTSLDDDEEWHALLDWVAGKRQPTPLAADCQAVFDGLGLVPR
jgi:hypothetical protein